MLQLVPTNLQLRLILFSFFQDYRDDIRRDKIENVHRTVPLSAKLFEENTIFFIVKNLCGQNFRSFI